MKFRTTSQAAVAAGVTPRTIRRWADRGWVKSVRTAGGHRRIDREDLQRVLHREPSDRK